MENIRAAELLKRVRTGDMAALHDIYAEFSVPLYTYIFRITKSCAVAEDVMQDTFLKLAKPAEADIKNASAYIYRAARNTALDALKKEKGYLLSGREEESSFENASVMRMDIERALMSLKSDVREIVTLHASAGLTFREIAKIMDISVPAVYRRYVKGIALLKEML